jgi:hypothetical protein
MRIEIDAELVAPVFAELLQVAARMFGAYDGLGEVHIELHLILDKSMSRKTVQRFCGNDMRKTRT